MTPYDAVEVEAALATVDAGLRLAAAVIAVALLARGGRLGDHGWRLAVVVLGLLGGHVLVDRWGLASVPGQRLDVVMGCALVCAALLLWMELVTRRLPLALVSAAMAWVLIPVDVPAPLWGLVLGLGVVGAWAYEVAPRAWTATAGAVTLAALWVPGGPGVPQWLVVLAIAAVGLGWQWLTDGGGPPPKDGRTVA